MADKKSDEKTGSPAGSKANERKTDADGRVIRAEVELPSGAKATIYRGKAKHHTSALKVARRKDGTVDEGRMYYALASYLVAINGEMLKIDEWEDVDYEDYLTIAVFLDEMVRSSTRRASSFFAGTTTTDSQTS